MPAEKWPDAAAINARINKSERANMNNRSPIHGMGDVFIRIGNKYNINPGIVVCISQRECQLGAALGDLIVPLNNFGGNTCGSVDKGTCGCEPGPHNRSWKKFCTPEDGIEGIFSNLNSSIYKDANGKLGLIMEKYAPRHENDWASMWKIFEQVASELGFEISYESNIYGSGGRAIAPGTTPGNSNGGLLDKLNPLDDVTGWIGDKMPDVFARTMLFSVGMLVLIVGLRAIVKTI